MKRFVDLSEQEVLALAISNEEDDCRIYVSIAQGLRQQYPSSAKLFEDMAAEEARHRTMLYDLYHAKFGEFLPLVRRQDVRGFIRHRPIWLVRPLGLDEVRKYVAGTEYETARFYRRAAAQSRDASVRELLVSLADAEDKHEDTPKSLARACLRRMCARERTRRLGAYSFCNIFSPGWPAGWMARCQRWRRCSPRRSRPTIPGRRSWSALPHRWARESRWASRKLCPTTAR
jgi:rubrerythrin